MSHYSEKLGLLIDGRWIGQEDGRMAENVTNPVDETVLAALPHATIADLDQALMAADRAFQSWRRVSAMERSRLLRHAADLIRERVEDAARNLTMEQGKPLAESRSEIMSCAEILDWHAEEGRRLYGRVIPARLDGVRQVAMREPVGVCVAFTPWNFPASQEVGS